MAESTANKCTKDLKVAFIGGGNMALALAKGFISTDTFRKENIFASARTERTLNVWKELGCQTSLDNKDAIKHSNVLFLAVKPHILPEVLAEIAPCITSEQLVISVAVAVSRSFIEKTTNGNPRYLLLARVVKAVLALPHRNLDVERGILHLGEGQRVVRVMPNLAAAIQCGVAGYCLGSAATKDDGAFIYSIMSKLGFVMEVSSDTMVDTVGGFFGSTAYVAMFVESLSDGAVKAGVPRKMASELATNLVLSSSKLLKETGKHPAQLKDEVCSPGGTTIAGLQKLEQGGFRAAVINAVDTSVSRAKEMSKNY